MYFSSNHYAKLHDLYILSQNHYFYSKTRYETLNWGHNITQIVFYKMEILDNTDIKLLKLLQDNSNRPIIELARLVNLSATPVAERIKRLEQDGYIKNMQLSFPTLS